MESVLTQSPLPHKVDHEEDERDLPFSNDNCDLSLDSYDSFQLMQSDHLHDTDEDDDLAKFMFGSPVTEDFSVPFSGNCDESTTPEPTQEYPSHDDNLDLDASEMAMLELLVLCDSSGARHGFYDDLLTLLRRHVKKGFVISKTKGQDSFLSNMRKKVPTPQPRTTIVSGHEIVHFPLLEMLRDLLGSSTFTDVNNLCVNPSVADCFSQFVPTTVEDCSESMSKQWAKDLFDSLEDFDPNNDLFFPLVLYADKTGTDVNQWSLLEPWMFTRPLLQRFIRESATSWQHLGFLPSLDHIGKFAFEELGPASNESQKKLQLHHDFLAVLLQEVKYAATNKPVMMINLGGEWQKRRLHIHVSVVMGNQTEVTGLHMWQEVY